MSRRKDEASQPGRIPFWQTPGFVCAVLVLITGATYSRACFNGFVNFDDTFYATDNYRVQGGLTGDNIRWALTSLEHANWHPLTWLSLQADATFFGQNPVAFHSTNVLLHVVNTVLLFWVLYRATGALAASGLTAALFALHPLHVESVAWVSERKDVLSALFWLLAMATYERYVARQSIGWYVATATLFVFGLAAKPMVVTLPFVLLLWDFWPLRRKVAVGLLVEKIPLFLLTLASCAMTYVAQQGTEAIRSTDVLSVGDRLAHLPLAYAEYLLKTIWPVNLAAYYPYTQARRSMGLAVVAAALLAAITLSAIRQRDRRPYLLVGWLWFLGALVPTIGLVQIGGQAIADRYTYIPLIGLFIAVVWGVDEFVRRINMPGRLVVAGMAAILVLLAFVTWTQINYWHDSVTLWQHARDVDGNDQQISASLGGALVGAGRDAEAVPLLESAVASNNADISVHTNLGVAFFRLHRYAESEAELKKAIRINPTDDVAVYNLAFVQLARGNTSEAIQALMEALRINPSRWTAELALAEILAKRGAGAEAQEHFERAVQIDQQAALATWRASHPNAADAAALAEQTAARSRSE